MTSEGWGADPEKTTDGWTNAQGAVEAEALETFPVKYESQPETEEPEAFRLRRNAEVQNWLTEKANLESIKTSERASRDKVTATLFPSPKKGTQRYDLGGGFKVKLQAIVTYKLGDKDKIDEQGNKISIEDQIRKMEQEIVDEFGEIGEQILKRLITWKPDLSGSQYEKLDTNNNVEAAIKAKIAEHLETGFGSPQLAFEEPK